MLLAVCGTVSQQIDIGRIFDIVLSTKFITETMSVLKCSIMSIKTNIIFFKIIYIYHLEGQNTSKW